MISITKDLVSFHQLYKKHRKIAPKQIYCRHLKWVQSTRPQASKQHTGVCEFKKDLKFSDYDYINGLIETLIHSNSFTLSGIRSPQSHCRMTPQSELQHLKEQAVSSPKIWESAWSLHMINYWLFKEKFFCINNNNFQTFLTDLRILYKCEVSNNEYH